jgi:flagellar hook protein FlgE
MGFSIDPSILNAASLRLSVIGNNISNSGVTGFQGSSFSDILASTNSTSQSNGIHIQGSRQLFTQGTIQTSQNSLDMAINGQGFFRLYRSSDNSFGFTRDGAFTLDKNGFVTNPTGDQLTGYGLDPSGKVSVGKLIPLQVDTNNAPPSATNIAKTNLILDSRSVVPVLAFDPADASSYNATDITTIYDKQGSSHTVQSYFVKSAADTWNIYTTVDNAATNPVPTPLPLDNGNSTKFFGGTSIPLTLSSTALSAGDITSIQAATTAAAAAPSPTINTIATALTNLGGGVDSLGISASDNILLKSFISSAQVQANAAGLTTAQFKNSLNTFFATLLGGGGAPVVAASNSSVSGANFGGKGITLHLSAGLTTDLPGPPVIPGQISKLQTGTNSISSALAQVGSTIDSIITKLITPTNGAIDSLGIPTADANALKAFVAAAGDQSKAAGLSASQFAASLSSFVSGLSGAATTPIILTTTTIVSNPAASLSFAQDGTLNGFGLWVGSTNPNSGGGLPSVSPATPLMLDTYYNDLTSATTPSGFPLGSNTLFKFDFSKTLQYSSDFLSSTSQDGFPTGQFQGVSVGKGGDLRAAYSSGQSVVVGQIVLANFKSPTNLSADRNNQFVETPSSGSPIINEPGKGGAGQVLGSNIETSNVDISSEMIKLISAQRTYQANSEVVKRQDQILQTIISMGQ